MSESSWAWERIPWFFCLTRKEIRIRCATRPLSGTEPTPLHKRLSPLSEFVSVFQGRLSIAVAELFNKMADLIITHVRADFRDRPVCVDDKVFCSVKAVFVQVFDT